MLKGVIVVLMLVACVAAFIGIERAEAQQVKRPWVMVPCYTLDDVTRLLNTLPPADALEAKVIANNSQRSLLGVWSNPYHVWHRK